MYHISDLKKFAKCSSLYFLDKNKQSFFKPYLRSEESLVELLKEYLGITEAFIGNTNDSTSVFFNNVDKYNSFINARFSDGDLRIKIPILLKNNDLFDAYFIYYGVKIKEIDAFSLNISYQVLKKNGISLRNVYLSTINPNYVYHNKLDPKNLFVINDTYKGIKIIDYIKDPNIDYSNIITSISECNFDNIKPIKTKTCHNGKKCPYYFECFKDEENLPNDSILTLVSSMNKYNMFNDNLLRLKDVNLESFETNRVQYAQIVASKNGGLFCDKKALIRWLKDFRYPISFIDFEWDRFLIPKYEGMKPLDVIPFEYVLYIDNGFNELEKKTYISKGDCRRGFIDSLMNNLPKEGSIIAYNAKGAEKLRIRELAEFFPELKEELEGIVNRIIDLADPFVNGIVYDVRFRGNFTLKKLVDVLSDKSYNNLVIGKGMDAVLNWRNIDNSEFENNSEIINELIDYCSLDSYGLVIVYKWLLSLTI